MEEAMESRSRKIINAIISNKDQFTNLEEFITLCEAHNIGETDDDAVLEYLQISGGCQEITDLLKDLFKSNAKEAEILLKFLTHILMRIATDLKLYVSVATSIANDVLNYAMRTIFNFLQVKQKPTRMKSALKLLTSVAIQNSQIAHNVFVKLSTSIDNFSHLFGRSNPVEEEDVRACLIHLVVAFLSVGDNNLIRQLVELKGFLNAVFPGLQHDRPPVICIVLTTLMSEIIENSGISKTSKVRLFNDFTMKYVLRLYTWQGPRRLKKTLKRKLGEGDEVQIIEARQEDVALVRNTAHQFMLALCCSYKNGIIFRDASYGTSGKNVNHVVTNILSSFPSPYSNYHMSELVTATLKTCPDILKFYIPKLKDSLVPRCTDAWINAVKLLKEVVSAQDPLICFTSGEKKPVPKLLTIVKIVCIPEVISGSQITQALEGCDQCVCYHLLDYLSCILKQVVKVIDFCKSSSLEARYSVLELMSLQKSLVTYFIMTFPVSDHLWNYWVRVIKDGFSTSNTEAMNFGIEFPAPSSLLSKILEVLLLLREVSPVSLKEVDMNLPDMLSGIKRHDNSLSSDELSSLQVQAIELIAGQGQVENIFFEKVKEEGRTSLNIVLDLYLSAENPKVLKSVSDLIYQLLRKTKIFEYGEWEIGLWLRGLKEVKKRYQTLAMKFLGSVLRAVFNESNKFIDEILTCIMECASQSNVSFTAIHMLEDFLYNEASTEGCEVFQEDLFLNMLHKQHCFSAMVPAALWCIESVSGSEKKACRQYVEFVLRHVMHRQHSPETFFILVQKHSDFFHCNLYNYWKLLYFLNTKAKIDCLEFAEENEQHEKTLSEKLQIAFISKFIQKKNNESDVEDDLKLFSDISDVKIEDTLYITWQILMYTEMSVAAITENKSIHLQVPEYLALLKKFILQAINNFNNTSKKRGVESSSDKTPESVALSSVITDVLSHPTILEFFLKIDVIQGNPNFSPLKRCTNAVTKFSVDIITCAHNNLNVIDVGSCLLLYKEKVIRFFTFHVVPSALEGKKMIVKSSWLEEIFRSFSNFLNKKDVVILLEHFLQLKTEAWLKLDPELMIISSLLKTYVEMQEQEGCLLSSEVLESLCSTYASIFDEKLRRCIGRSVLSVLEKHPEYASSVSSEICLSLLNRQAPEDLDVLSILLKNNHACLEAIQKSVVCNAKTWDSWNSVFILSLAAKCVCMDVTYSSSSCSSFQQCISLPFWTTLSCLLLHDFPAELTDTTNCDIGKTVSLLVANKHLEVKKLKKLMKTIENSGTELNPAKMGILLQILKNITSDFVATELPPCSFAIKYVMNWLLEVLSMSKSLEDPIQVKLLNDCIVVLKNVDVVSIEHAVSDNALWTKFLLKVIKVALKSEHAVPSLLEIIKSFCERVHQSSNSTLISASHIYELLTSHSNFFQVLLDENKQYSSLKGNVVDVLVLLVHLDSKVCKEGHISLFLAAYGGTLSLTDQKLLYLILLYEKSGINMFTFSPFLWSKAAIAHYSVQKDTRLFLWKQPKMEEVLGNFVAENLLLTSLNFPLDLSLEPTYPPVEFTTLNASDECDLYSIYDPRFVLPLTSVLLSPGSFVHCRTFLESKVLGVVFTSLSSHNPGVRAVGYYCLSQFYEHLQISGFSEKLVWISLLDSIKNAIAGSNPRLPSMITVFLAKAVDVLMKPDNPLYVPLYKFLMVKPTLDLGQVPEFYTLFGSADIEYRVQRSWILTLLADGMRSSLDFHLCQKRYVFSILLPYFNSSICMPQEKVKILKILSAAVSIYSSARILCHSGLLPWLHNAIKQCDEEDGIIFKYFVHIIKMLWLQKDKDAPEKKMYSSFASELLLVELSLLKKLKALDATTLHCYLETLHSTLTHVKVSVGDASEDGNPHLPFVSLPVVGDQDLKHK